MKPDRTLRTEVSHMTRRNMKCLLCKQTGVCSIHHAVFFCLADEPLPPLD